MKHRSTELGLILLGGGITAALYALAGLGSEASIPANIGPFLVVVLGLLAVAHLAVRRFAPHADGVLLPLAGLLNGIGYVFIARLGNLDLASKQSLWTALGILGFVATLMLVPKIRKLEQYRYTFAVAGIAMLLLPLLPFVGTAKNGSRIWITLGPASVQPGEFAKIALAVFFASYLVDKRELLSLSLRRIGPLHIPDPKYLGPLLLAWGMSLVVMTFQKDLGSSLLFFTMFTVMLWVATSRVFYLASGWLLFSGGAFAAWSFFPHVQVRVSTWLNPWDDPFDTGYQVIQGWYGLAWGGLTGTGPGVGRPDLIPVAETDFIFAVVGEELGMVGATALLLAYVLMVGTGLRIAMQATQPFQKLLAVGLTTLLGFQSFIIIAGVVRLLPLTGVTLPFVSYGGSSLLANYILLALLIRISHEVNAKGVAPKEKRPSRVKAAIARRSSEVDA